ncbi:MAG: rhomboid-like protein, partial [Jatrophihabitantaceae bacterium]
MPSVPTPPAQPSFRSLLSRLPLTVGFAGTLAAAEIWYAALSARQAARVAGWASTNVARLTSEPVGPLAASVFVVDDYQVLWLVLATLGCALVEVRFGWRRALLLAATAQLGGTAVSEGILGWRVGHARLPESALHQTDVGGSYVVVGLLMAAVVA